MPLLHDLIEKALRRRASLTHSPSLLQMARGGRKRRGRVLGRSALFNKDITAGGVHVPTALSNEKPPRKKRKTQLSIAYDPIAKFTPDEPRDQHGRWLRSVAAQAAVHGGLAATGGGLLGGGIGALAGLPFGRARLGATIGAGLGAVGAGALFGGDSVRTDLAEAERRRGQGAASLVGVRPSRQQIRRTLTAHGAATGREQHIAQDVMSGKVRTDNLGGLRAVSTGSDRAWLDEQRGRQRLNFHNHPSTTEPNFPGGAITNPPSSADLLGSWRGGKEIVYGSDGSIYHHSLPADAPVLSVEHAVKLHGAIKAADKGLDKAGKTLTFGDLAPGGKANKKNWPREQDFDYRLQHERNKVLAEKGWLNYRYRQSGAVKASLARTAHVGDRFHDIITAHVPEMPTMVAKNLFTKREFSEEQRKAAAKTGAAMPGGEYPIKTAGDLHNAIQAIGRAKNSAATRRYIEQRARALGATSALPSDWVAKRVAEVIRKDWASWNEEHKNAADPRATGKSPKVPKADPASGKPGFVGRGQQGGRLNFEAPRAAPGVTAKVTAATARSGMASRIANALRQTGHGSLIGAGIGAATLGANALFGGHSSEVAKAAPATKEKIAQTMREWKAGRLRSGGNGAKVTDQRQAIAIALSQTRRAA